MHIKSKFFFTFSRVIKRQMKTSIGKDMDKLVPSFTTGEIHSMFHLSGKFVSYSNTQLSCNIAIYSSGGLEDKASAYNAGDPSSILGLGRSPGEGNGNPLQYSCLKNPMDRGAWQATVHRVAKSRTRLNDFTSLHFTS